MLRVQKDGASHCVFTKPEQAELAIRDPWKTRSPGRQHGRAQTHGSLRGRGHSQSQADRGSPRHRSGRKTGHHPSLFRSSWPSPRLPNLTGILLTSIGTSITNSEAPRSMKNWLPQAGRLDHRSGGPAHPDGENGLAAATDFEAEKPGRRSSGEVQNSPGIESAEPVRRALQNGVKSRHGWGFHP